MTEDGGRTAGRRPRRDEVRARVLEAAAGVVAERGLAGASLDQVAAAAGFTKGAVYSNFASKDELFLALLEHSSARRIEAVEDALGRARDVPEALGAVAAELGRPDAGGQLLLVEFWQRAVRDPEVRAAFVRSRRACAAGSRRRPPPSSPRTRRRPPTGGRGTRRSSPSSSSRWPTDWPWRGCPTPRPCPTGWWQGAAAARALRAVRTQSTSV